MGVEWARKYVGEMFDGEGPGRSLDCWGFARKILMERYGKILPPFNEVVLRPDRRKATADDIARCIPLVDAHAVEEPAPGDLALMFSFGYPVHIGVVVEESMILHSEPGKGGVLERRSKLEITKRVKGYYRVD